MARSTRSVGPAQLLDVVDALAAVLGLVGEEAAVGVEDVGRVGDQDVGEDEGRPGSARRVLPGGRRRRATVSRARSRWRWSRHRARPCRRPAARSATGPSSTTGAEELGRLPGSAAIRRRRRWWRSAPTSCPGARSRSPSTSGRSGPAGGRAARRGSRGRWPACSCRRRAAPDRCSHAQRAVQRQRRLEVVRPGVAGHAEAARLQLTQERFVVEAVDLRQGVGVGVAVQDDVVDVRLDRGVPSTTPVGVGSASRPQPTPTRSSPPAAC